MSSYGVNATVTGALTKPFESWAWYAGGTAAMPTFQYEAIVPASLWVNLTNASSTTPVAASAILQSNGAIKFPVNGVYTINFNAETNQASIQRSWWTINTVAAFGITNNTTLYDRNLGTQAQYGTCSYTGFFTANDTVWPTVFCPNSGGQVLNNTFRSVMNVTLIHRC